MLLIITQSISHLKHSIINFFPGLCPYSRPFLHVVLLSVYLWPHRCDLWSTVIGIHSIERSRGAGGGQGGGGAEGKGEGREEVIKMSDFQRRQFISQLSWNMTGCWWMKQEGRGASVWQVVSRFMECLPRRAKQSGVQYNGLVFRLTLPTWERLTFNFGFCLWLITVCDCHIN